MEISKTQNLSALRRYLPLPATKGVGAFRDFAEVLGRVSNTVGSLISAGGGSSAIDASNFQQLINEQVKLQYDLQKFSLASNLERSKHETKMSVLRNTRVA